MAGWMGTGKSTIARAAATATGAIVLDHDTTKTALLEAGVTHPPAGAASYRVVHAIAADLLSQGHSVIIDSPALYESIPEIGAAIAAQANARYLFVECQCPDEIADRRIESRTNRTSQAATAAEARSIREDPNRTPARPAGAVILDTTLAEAESVGTLLGWLRSDQLDSSTSPDRL
ncbi:MAG: AAA family ATPase [Acidimicrobiales bacterium]